MNIKHSTGIVTGILWIPALAQAQTQALPADVEPSAWGRLFWTVLPVFIVAVIFIVFIRRMQRPILKRTRDHMERQVQHMERVEQSLDRIIKLLEKKN
jgi:Kef-type K+ transport system membrane component KefB